MPLTVLVVEDEESNMQIITISLEALGHNVVPACDPFEGLALAHTCVPDVILMDLMFKGASIDGLEAIRRLKADPATAAIPIVAQTAAVLDYGERAVLQTGASGYLQKPFRRKQLLAAIESAVAGTPITTWHHINAGRPIFQACALRDMCVHHIPAQKPE